VTTTTLESKDPTQAPDVNEDPDIGGGASSDKTDTDATPEPELPSTDATPEPGLPSVPTTDTQPNPAQETLIHSGPVILQPTMPPRSGLALVQQILDAA
jgi:hypothetical protein